jgi:nucleoside-diphosphate-sugar epimerase
MKVLVTGANGFVGSAVCRALLAAGMEVAGAVRGGAVPGGVARRVVGDIGPGTDWRGALEGIDVVVHCAARVHVMRERAADPLAEFRFVNRDGAVALARQAEGRRLIFVSTIKVNGEETAAGRPFRADDVPAPVDPYGIAKAEAEAQLAEIHRDLVVIRPPLVVGAGAKGNLAGLMKLVAAGVPLPFASIDNRRSLVGRANLADLIRACVTHPAAPGKTFLVRDDPDVSTPDLVRRLGMAMGRRARLLPFPVSLLGAMGKAGRRLTGSLTVDDGATREVLGWTPPFGLDEGLREMAAEYIESHR